MRAIPLTEQSDGINLLRSKGGASPSGLFDLVNGYVSPKRTINARPGTVLELTLPVGTLGVVGFEDKFHTFAAEPIVDPVDDARVVVHVLRRSDGITADLTKVHRAFPFLGRLYVVAEFADSAVRHFWIENPSAWAASTAYSYGQKVVPSVDNGFYYVIEDADPTAAWQNNTEVVVGDYKQPTTANGFKYQATAIAGTAPFLTSDSEPAWPATEGATVTERRYVTAAHVPPGTAVPSTPDTSGGSAGTEYGPFPPNSDGRIPSSTK